MSEQDLVNTIIEYVHTIGGVAIRINSGMRVIENDDGTRRAFRGAPTGTSDILACIHGKFYAIECKVGRNKATDAQRLFLERVAEAGGRAIIAYELEDVEREVAYANSRADQTGTAPGS